MGKMLILRNILFGCMVPVLAIGCESESEPDSGATLARVQNEVFEVSCNSAFCHGNAAAGGLDLSTAEKSYTNMVNVTAKLSEMLLVVPGDPDMSFLVKKFAPDAGEGAVMPIGGSISAAKRQLVSDWIAAGANK